jgi:hypothetical protein
MPYLGPIGYRVKVKVSLHRSPSMYPLKSWKDKNGYMARIHGQVVKADGS